MTSQKDSKKSAFAQNQSQVRRWLMQTVSFRESEMDPSEIAEFLCMAFIDQTDIKENKGAQKNRKEQIQSLWSKNQYFQHCLIDFSEDLIHYAFAANWKTRAKFPRCVLGYYELTKNIVHYKQSQGTLPATSTKNKYSSKIEEDAQHKNRDQFHNVPACLKLFAQEKMIRILFIDSSIAEIKNGLLPIEQSKNTRIFLKDMHQLILSRFQAVKEMFSLRTRSQRCDETVAEFFLRELESKDETKLDMSIDQTFLCLTFACYKAHKEKIVFSKIIDVYEAALAAVVNRQKIVRLYNQVFILECVQKLSNGIFQQIEIDQKGNSKNVIVGKTIKEERSIFDMFQ